MNAQMGHGEAITEAGRRRRFSEDDKARIIEETLWRVRMGWRHSSCLRGGGNRGSCSRVCFGNRGCFCAGASRWPQRPSRRRPDHVCGDHRTGDGRIELFAGSDAGGGALGCDRSCRSRCANLLTSIPTPVSPRSSPRSTTATPTPASTSSCRGISSR
jgi:hypothetical protein